MITLNVLKKICFALAVLMLCDSCNSPSPEELLQDPNKATSVPPSLLLTSVLKSFDNFDNEGPWSDAQKDNQFWVISFNYYGNQDYNFGATNFYYSQTLSNVVAMEKEAQKYDTKNKYKALATFFKAYFFDYMSKRVGDIPMNDALKGLDSPYPKYDNQKDIYVNILSLLDQANDEITLAQKEIGTGAIEGDYLYKGDLNKWQRAINAFHLRILISLSKKTSEIDVVEQFKNIVNNPEKYPLLRDGNDNLQRVFSSETGNYYPRNPNEIGYHRNRDILSSTYINNLKANKDPRLFIVADPAPALYNAATPYNLNAYVGANTGDEQGQMQRDSDAGKYSYPSLKRYYNNYTGEPYLLIGYSEQQFTIAEAIHRGWINGDAATYYKEGITSSMQYYGVADADIASFLNNPNVVYQGIGTDGGLNQILIQKFLAFFQNSGRESFFNQRRTGIPTYNIGPSNKNGLKIPKRWKYPQSEFNNNATNVNAALARQYNGSDDINAIMWLIK